MLPIGVLFLTTFVNNTLFIQVDNNVRESYICLSVNNVTNDTWPSAWIRMSVDYGLFKYKINDNILNRSTTIQYKLKLYYYNNIYKVTKNWNDLYIKSHVEECNISLCIITLTIFLIILICIMGYILFNIYLHYK